MVNNECWFNAMRRLEVYIFFLNFSENWSTCLGLKSFKAWKLKFITSASYPYSHYQHTGAHKGIHTQTQSSSKGNRACNVRHFPHQPNTQHGDTIPHKTGKRQYADCEPKVEIGWIRFWWARRRRPMDQVGHCMAPGRIETFSRQTTC